MSIMNEMLRDLERQNERKESTPFLNAVPKKQAPEVSPIQNNEAILSLDKTELKPTRFNIMYSCLFFGVALWIWDKPQQAEKVALNTISGAQTLFVFVKDLQLPKIENTKKELVITKIEQPNTESLVKSEAQAQTKNAPLLNELALSQVHEKEKPNTESTKAMTEVVKSIAANVIQNTKEWESEKEEAISHLAKPILNAKLKDIPPYLSLEDVEIENVPGHTRLRLMVNGDVNQVIEKTLDGRHMNIMLPNTHLRSALPPVAGARSPIIALNANSRLGDLVLTLELQSETATQSSVIAHPEGTELVLDFMNTPQVLPQQVAAPVYMPAPTMAMQMPAPQVVQAPAPAHAELPALPPIYTEIAQPKVLTPDPKVLGRPEQTNQATEKELSARADVGRMSILPHRVLNQGVEGNLTLALRALETGNLEEARLLLEENVRTYPRHVKSVAALSDLLIREGDRKNAAALLRDALNRMPEHTLLIKKMAELYRSEGKIEDALVLLRKNMPRLIEDPEYHSMMAAMLQQQGKSDEAEEIYSNLVHHHPEQGMWWMGLGMAQESAGDKSSALKSYKNAQAKPNMDTKLLNFINDKVKQLSKK